MSQMDFFLIIRFLKIIRLKKKQLNKTTENVNINVLWTWFFNFKESHNPTNWHAV